jgi:hypothetical protein
MTSPARDYTLIRTKIENDPYNPVLVEDLINGLNDWRSVQDIVRLTFKALSDVVKSQGASLKEIEIQLPGKASKSEVSQCISLKNSYSDIIRTISDLKAANDSKMNSDDVYSIVEEKVSRSDLQYLLSTKASYEELRSSLSEKADTRDLQSEIRAIRAIIDEMNEENYRKFQLCVSKRDLQQLEVLVETKANKDEIAEILEEKANKQSVANALHRKANKTDVESLIAARVELTEFNKVFESVQELQSQIILKAEKSEVAKYQESSRKTDKAEMESAVLSLQESQKDSENKIFSYISKLEGFSTSLRSKIDEIQSFNAGILTKKCDVKDLENLSQTINRKADTEYLKDLVSSLQKEFKEQVRSNRLETRQLEDLYNEKWSKLDQNLNLLQSDVAQAHENIKIVSEYSRVNLEEGVKSVHHYTGSKLEEIRVLRLEIDRLHREIEEIRHVGVDKSEFRKGIDNKIDSRELKEFVDKNNRELVRQLQFYNEELRDLILRKEKELTLMIDKKPGVHEINSLILENTVSRMNRSSIDH